MSELIPIDPKKYDPEKFEQRILDLIQADRWLVGLNPPFDSKEFDPRRSAVLETPNAILGRIALSLHAGYDESCTPGFPLLKADRGKNKVQFAIPSDKPGLYWLVLMLGTKQGNYRNCQIAKLVETSEAEMERAKKEFLYYSKYSDTEKHLLRADVLPTWPKNGTLHHSLVKGDFKCFTLEFSSTHHIRRISSVYPTGGETFYFPFNQRVHYVYLKDIYPQYQEQQIYASSEAFLDRDGQFRAPTGQEIEIDLAKKLFAVSQQLPVKQYIRD